MCCSGIIHTSLSLVFAGSWNRILRKTASITSSVSFPEVPKEPHVTETANWHLPPGTLFFDKSIKNSACLLTPGCQAREMLYGNLRLLDPICPSASLWFCGVTTSYQIHSLLHIATGFCCNTDNNMRDILTHYFLHVSSSIIMSCFAFANFQYHFCFGCSFYF